MACHNPKPEIFNMQATCITKLRQSGKLLLKLSSGNESIQLIDRYNNVPVRRLIGKRRPVRVVSSEILSIS